MGNPDLKISLIHVTGTNGKGSVIRKIAACLMEAGKPFILHIYSFCIIVILISRVQSRRIHLSTSILSKRENNH